MFFLDIFLAFNFLSYPEESAIWNDALEGNSVDVTVKQRRGDSVWNGFALKMKEKNINCNSTYSFEDAVVAGQDHWHGQLHWGPQDVGVPDDVAVPERLLDLVVVLDVLLKKYSYM